ncbi:L10-interacting MYB domain-containing protein-like [Malus domestica]|uniref:L10-interacting MYB domain-containing protein-like n=1 Tax=Malus domestica TaxID=3750 RepID=UPI0010A99F25|nr:L10-interacting MYB domain-containing protein-like [Malus domestica]
MWDDASVEIFISVCVVETLAGNQTGGHLNRIGWKNVIKKFNDLTQRSYVHKQLKNKWTTLKKEWQLWASLVGKETGLGWDPVKQTIIASDEWWEKKVKLVIFQENSEVAKYRNSGLKNVDQLDILFKEGAVTGVGAWAPSQGLMSNNVQKAPTCKQNDGQDDLENDIDNNEGLDDIADVETPSPAQPSTQGRGTKRTRDSKRVGIGAKMIKQLDGILEAVNNRSKSIDKPGCSIEEVMQMLEGMHEVVNDDELFMKAADIFTERKNREMFVALKQSNRQIMWLKSKKI